ncbi:MAG: thioredoxin domain-containing protein [Pseudomonadales bacterium]|nr:thioredoxin domain-containing protein [Pseudomonadales bacterium]
MFKSFSTLTATAVLVFLSAIAIAEQGEFLPYKDVHSESELGKSVDSRVLFFAHFTCPYCRQAHGYLGDWGDGLPRPYRFEIVPAVGLKEHVPMASAFYAALQIAPEKMPQFIDAMYAQLQDTGRATGDKHAYLNAAASVGITADHFSRVVVGDKTRRYVERAAELTKIYSVNEVPSLVVANRFATAPARVGNDKQLTLSLLNGLLSQDMQAKGFEAR